MAVIRLALNKGKTLPLFSVDPVSCDAIERLVVLWEMCLLLGMLCVHQDGSLYIKSNHFD